MMHQWRVLIWMGMLIVSGCSLLHPPKIRDIKEYTLEGPLFVAYAPPKTSLSILVANTQANGFLDTNKMIYSRGPHQVGYFAKNRWAAPPATMLTPLLANSLEAKGYFRAVVLAPFYGATNWRLNTTLITFQQNFDCVPSRVIMQIYATISDVETGKVLASRGFSTIVTAPMDNPQGGVIAANKAQRQLVREITDFCARTALYRTLK